MSKGYSGGDGIMGETQWIYNFNTEKVRKGIIVRSNVADSPLLGALDSALSAALDLIEDQENRIAKLELVVASLIKEDME